MYSTKWLVRHTSLHLLHKSVWPQETMGNVVYESTDAMELKNETMPSMLLFWLWVGEAARVRVCESD